MSDNQTTKTAGAPFSQTIEGKVADLEASNAALKRQIVARDTEIATLRAELATVERERTQAKNEAEKWQDRSDQRAQAAQELAAALQLCKNTLGGHLDEPQAVSHAECRNAAIVAGNAIAKWEAIPNRQ